MKHGANFRFFFQAEDGIRDLYVTGVQTCALPIWRRAPRPRPLGPGPRLRGAEALGPGARRLHPGPGAVPRRAAGGRSEERRVGESVDNGGICIIMKKVKCRHRASWINPTGVESDK